VTRRPKQPKRARLRDIDKPIIATYGRRYHANRDFVTARVARNRRRLRRILMVLAALLFVGAVAYWWAFTHSMVFTVAAAPADARRSGQLLPREHSLPCPYRLGPPPGPSPWPPNALRIAVSACPV